MRKPERDELPEELNALTAQIIKAAMEVHSELGPGLFERVYRRCMLRELSRMGIRAETELRVPVCYKGQLIDDEGYRIDLLVDDTVVVELKSVEAVTGVHKKQVLTYVRLKRKPLGLLITFIVEHLREGIFRILDPRRGV